MIIQITEKRNIIPIIKTMLDEQGIWNSYPPGIVAKAETKVIEIEIDNIDEYQKILNVLSKLAEVLY